MRSLALAAFVLLAGCFRPQTPEITVESATVTSMTPEGMGMKIHADAYNPNSFDLTARSLTAKITCSGKYDMGTVTSNTPLTLGAGKHTKIDVPLAVKWDDLPQLALLAATNAAVPYVIEGAVAVGGETLNVNVPLRLEGDFTHEQIVQAAKKSLPAALGH